MRPCQSGLMQEPKPFSRRTEIVMVVLAVVFGLTQLGLVVWDQVFQ